MVPGPRKDEAGRRASAADRLGEALAFWAIALFCLFLLFAAYWIPAARKLGPLTREEKNVDAEIRLLTEENRRLERRLHALYSDPYYVERFLRKEHGFREEGEKAIKPKIKVVGE